MSSPFIAVNFKAYEAVCGSKGLRLAEICEGVSDETGVQIIVAPQMVELSLVATRIRIPVWAQSADAVSPGGRTGHTTIDAISGAGAKGVLINHSECRKKMFDIDYLIKLCREKKIKSCVCTNNLEVSLAAAAMDPDFVAIEPPELIGGDVSVTTADPEIVRSTVEKVRKINRKIGVLCGAGVKNSQDVRKAIELGTCGVLLASGVVKASNPKKVLLDLASGF
ncbi:MAG: triose-phosphate isomerase [Candidatus Methanofastidiosia archaeon]